MSSMSGRRSVGHSKWGHEMSKHKREKGRLPPFVPLLKGTLDAPAWKAMSMGARMLYVALKRRYNRNNHNNGRLFISQRDASAEMGTHHNQVARWFRELQHFGFIVQTSAGALGVDGKGKAPHWRLTELDYMTDLATRDFDRWNGEPFKDRKTESRAGKSARGVPESQHTNVPESQHTNGNKCAGKSAHTAATGVMESQRILRPPLHATKPALTAEPRWKR